MKWKYQNKMPWKVVANSSKFLFWNGEVLIFSLVLCYCFGKPLYLFLFESLVKTESSSVLLHCKLSGFGMCNQLKYWTVMGTMEQLSFGYLTVLIDSCLLLCVTKQCSPYLYYKINFVALVSWRWGLCSEYVVLKMGLIFVQWSIIIIADYNCLFKSFKTNKETNKNQQRHLDKAQMFGKQVDFCNLVLKILNNIKKIHTWN